jgi:hypothetical protein
MAETSAQNASAMPVSKVRNLIRDLVKQKLGQADSTLRDIYDEQEGEELANPDVLEYKQSTRG